MRRLDRDAARARVRHLSDGRHQEAEVSVSGGAGNLNYYASGSLLDDRASSRESKSEDYTGE